MYLTSSLESVFAEITCSNVDDLLFLLLDGATCNEFV